MKITINGRHMTVGAGDKELAQKKLSKLEKFFRPDDEATVTFGYKREHEIIEITIVSGGVTFRAEEEDVTFRCALDKATETIERQIRKNKTKLEKRLHGRIALQSIPDVPQEEEELKIRVKTFPEKPMSVEEAILQMDLLSHNFFAFSNSEDDGRICVVYSKKDGSYGLLMPD